MAKPFPAIKTWAGMIYTYNGSLHPRKRMQINNCYLELEEDVVQKLANDRFGVEDVSEGWLQAQLLLRGSGRPGEEIHWTKCDMISRLMQIILILEDKYYIGALEHSIEVFHNLEEVWAKVYPKHPASKAYLENKTPHNASRCWCFATQRKNLLSEKILPATVIKRSRPDAAEFGEASDHPHKRQRLPSPTSEPGIDNGENILSWIAQTSGAPPTPPEHVDHLPREVLDPLSQLYMSSILAIDEEHRRFKLHNYMSYVAGTYMILCPLLQARHPDLIGQLSITIKYLGASSLTSGILEAYFNFGKFTGPAILGLDDDRIAEWLWATATERRGIRAPASYENDEVERLCEDALNLAMERTPERKRANVETRHLRDLPALDIDTTALPQLHFDARLDNPTGEFYDPGTYRIAQGDIRFEERGLRFSGMIRIPEIAEGDLEFEGLRVFRRNDGDLPQKWKDVPTSKVHH